MKSILFFFSFLFCTICMAQEPLSKENGKIIVGIYIDGYQSGDTLKMKSVMHPRMSIQTAYLSNEQKNLVLFLNPSDLLKYTAASTKDQKWSLKLQDYIVNSDGNVAHVWATYYFYINDEFIRCGVNSFTLVYTDESWKILNFIDSRRIGSCNPE